MNLKSTNPIDPIDAHLRDLPLHQLEEIDVSNLSPAELKSIIKLCQEQRTSGQQRKSKNVRQSKKLTGQISDPLDDF